jgi:hypothetical protein
MVETKLIELFTHQIYIKYKRIANAVTVVASAYSKIT